MVNLRTDYSGRVAPVEVFTDNMGAFEDLIYFRDVKGASARPAIVSCRRDGKNCIHIRDNFLVQQEYIISPDQGQKFLAVTRDPNELHARQSVVPGAMTAAKALLPLEVLTPNLRINSIRAKFTAPAFYDVRAVSTMAWRYRSENDVSVRCTTYQRGRVVALININGQVDPDFAPEEIKERKVNQEQLENVREFFKSLGVAPDAYFRKGEVMDYHYPFAYMASLPSAEIVRQFEGQGGMINVLTLEPGDVPRMPITGKSRPEVKLTEGRLRRAFRRIVADIIDGIVTYYRGTAVVHPTAEFS